MARFAIKRNDLTWMAAECQNSNNMVTSRWALGAALCLSFALFGCKASSDFSEDVARGAIESAPMKLEGEQVTINDTQMQCGLRAEYWEPPVATSNDRSSAHLTSKGRELKFNDDLIVHDPSSRVAFIQVRGEFPLVVDSIVSMKDAGDQTNKLVEAKVRAKIEDPCFPEGVPLMGVRHGNFSADSPVVFHMHLDDSGWHVDKLVH